MSPLSRRILRLVWPSAVVAALAALHVAVVVPLAGRTDQDSLAAFVLTLAVGGHAVLHQLQTNPVLRHGHLGWLATTPWRPGRPLPLGDPGPSAAQVLLVAAAALLAWLTGIAHPLWPVLVVLVVTAATVAVGLERLAHHGPAVALVVALPIPLFPGGWYLVMPVAVALHAYALIETRHFLARHLADWQDHLPVATRRRARDLASVAPAQRLLVPVAGGYRRQVLWGLAAVTLVAWYQAPIVWRVASHELLSEMAARQFEPEEPFVAILVIVAAGFRLLAYLVTQQGIRLWPLGPLGRLRHGRLLVPGYDVVLLGPALMVAFGLILPWCWLWVGLPAWIGHCLTALIVLALAFLVPPSRGSWHLTGDWRLVAYRSNRQPGISRTAG